MKLNLTMAQVNRISQEMEESGDCQDFVEDSEQMAGIIEACVLSTVRELNAEQVEKLFNSI